MDQNGWIKLHRSVLDDDLYFSEPFTRMMAWIDILLFANHKPNAFYIRGNKIEVGRGQFARSETGLATRWRWSRNKIRTFLALLEKDGKIVQQKNNPLSLYTVLNYDQYQSEGTTEGQQKVQQKDINKNVKNDKNDKKNNILADKSAIIPLNEMLALFEKVNPTFERLFANKSQRASLQRLVDKFGIEKMTNLLTRLHEIVVKPFAPQISTPIELENKMGKLIQYLNQEKLKVTKNEVTQL